MENISLFGLAVFALVGALAALVASGVTWLRTRRQNYPDELEIEKALYPIIFKAICSAFRLSEVAMDEVEKRMGGWDKKGIADSVYGLLPDKVGEYDLTLVKRLVTVERFEVLVQNAFDDFDKFYRTYEGHFSDLLDDWIEDNDPDKEYNALLPGGDDTSGVDTFYKVPA